VEVARSTLGALTLRTNLPLYISFGYRSDTGTSYYFTGRIDEVAVYSRALSASEVQLHYDSGRQ
jgi:hypothetical protein